MIRDVVTAFETIDIPVTGKLVKCTATVDEHLMQMKGQLPETDRKFIREQLARQIAGFLLDNNMIEFTQQMDPIMHQTHIMGRIFVTPNADTKLLRTLKR